MVSVLAEGLHAPIQLHKYCDMSIDSMCMELSRVRG